MQARLKALRQFHKITSEEMAAVVGIHENSYLKKENGQTQFKLNEMFLIANRLNMKVDDVFTPTSREEE